MKEKRIVNIIEELKQTDEHHHLEVKRGSEVGRSILETICAFANEPGLGGGTIVLGIAEDKSTHFRNYKIVGVEDADKIQKDVASQCASLFNQSIRPKITVEHIDNKNVVLIDVDEVCAQAKPIYFNHLGLPRGAYRRIGSTDQQCTEDDLHLFFNKKDAFDSAVILDSELNDLSDEAVMRYRKLRKEVNASAEELQYNDIDLLRSINCIKKLNGEWRLTNAGLLVFGKKIALRRLMPMVRVDYIRVSGNKWVENPDERFTSKLDLQGPLIDLVYRAISVIVDDLPSDFLLPEGELQAKSKWRLPYRVLREAVVNAFIHRSYRINQPTQIIRFSNRIEIRNAGYSLKPIDQIGEPGSVIRNTHISAIFHETNLAETKGTGFKTMENLMKASGMIPPTYESDHAKNSFVLRLLLHHFLNEDDVVWLEQFSRFSYSDSQKLGLVFLREVGAIDNVSYRQLTGLSSIEAGSELRRLRKDDMLTQKGAGKSTYYLPSQLFDSFCSNKKDLSPQSEGLSPQAKGLSPQTKDLSPQESFKELVNQLPNELKDDLANLGKRTNNKLKIKQLIINLCSIQPLSITELSTLLKREDKYLKKNYLRELIKNRELEFTIPDMISHPDQKYKATNNE